MSPSFWVWSHAAFVLLLGGMLFPIFRRVRAAGTLLLVIVILIGLSMLPVFETDLSGFVLAHTGTLSVPTMMLLLTDILVAGGLLKAVPTDARRNATYLWVATGTVLYPSAMGFTEFDMYALGYTRAISWGVVIVCGLMMAFRQQLPALFFLLAVIAHEFQLHESPNLWDYLIDPWLWLFSGAHVVWMLAAGSKRAASLQDPAGTHI